MNIFIVYRTNSCDGFETVAALANSEALAQEICDKLRATNTYFTYSYSEKMLCQTIQDLW